MGEKKVNLFGLEVSTMGLLETAKWIIKSRGGAKIYCCTLNEAADAFEKNWFKKMLFNGTILTADGMPLVWEMKRKTGNGERVYGPDLIKLVLEKTKNMNIKHLLIGSRENIKLGNKNNCVYYVPEYKDKFGEDDIEKMIGIIRKSKVDIVWVSLGAEKQIEVVDSLAKILPEKIYVTVGAAFDFLSGNKRQAPKWVQKSGCEWVFRLANEPRRLSGRYFKCVVFLFKYYSRELTAFWKSGVPGSNKP